MENLINVIVCDDSVSKGLFDASILILNKEISSHKLTKNINNVITALCEGFNEIKKVSSWEIDEITVKLEISASGEVKLVGALSSGMLGGIEIKLKRCDR